MKNYIGKVKLCSEDVFEKNLNSKRSLLLTFQLDNVYNPVRLCPRFSAVMTDEFEH